jgi:hypothetical protein
MKIIYSLLIIIGLALIGGCQSSEGNTMVLLDEKVKEVNVSNSVNVGEVNPNIIFSYDEKEAIKVFENAIKTAVKQTTNIETIPDYDVLVEYDGGLPTHAIHLWLGEEDEKSILMYMVGEGETYVTSSKATNELRGLLFSE